MMKFLQNNGGLLLFLLCPLMHLFMLQGDGGHGKHTESKTNTPEPHGNQRKRHQG